MSHTDDDLQDIPLDKTAASDNKSEKISRNVEYNEDLNEEIGPVDEAIEEEEEPEFYDPNAYISSPRISTNGTLPKNILNFHFSFGYNCRKNFNLVVLDSETLVFASGNFINFFEIETRKIWFRRSALGGGIGHIRKNPNPEYPHFAVAECGHRPIIIIYEWPSLNIVCVLRGGAKRLYSNMDYSPDGELLVSQSGEPDYLITLWNWKEHKILLRNKSYVNDVFRVKFSPYISGQLTTCGVAHIKFWKMATTFTGLKLKGEVGRFGKTEYSDILGVLPMPDSKVVSGCDWGNILVWDAGLITLEIFRSLRRRCHDAPIVQFFYEDSELWTVSLDGHVRIWWYEKIDHADPPDDDRVILIDPSYDFYTPGLQLYCVEQRYAGNPDESWFVAQDGNGGIWQIDLNTDVEPRQSIQLYKCHAGKVVDIAACPFGPFLASFGKDGRLYVYNYLLKELVFHQEFPAHGTCMIWLDSEISSTGDIIIAGFDDGQIRVCMIDLYRKEDISLTIIQVIKPHNKPITKISINSSGTRLVSGGEDSTIFFFKLTTSEQLGDVLTPIGFIPAPDVVTCFTWHPNLADTVLVGCLHGQMMQVNLPYDPKMSAKSSYLLVLQPQYKNFMSYKAQIRRNIRIRQIERKKAKKVAKKRKEMEQIKKENPGLEIDEEVFLADSDSEEELEPLHIPEVPNKILWLKYTESGTIWLSMGGYDAGYIYEYMIDQKEDVPYKFKMVYDGDDIEISSYIYDCDKKYIIFAMQDGSIRVNKVNHADYTDLSDYWTLAMHDNQHGFVPKMCFSFDGKFFFSCGHDGNVFSYQFQPPPGYLYPTIPKEQTRLIFPMAVHDSDNYVKLSLEETMTKAESDRIQQAANEHKANIRKILKSLKERYIKVLDKNKKLLPSQVIPRETLELDERVTNHIEQEFQSQLDLVRRKLAYSKAKSEKQMKKLRYYVTDPVDKHPLIVKAINNPSIELLTVRQRVMGSRFSVMVDLVENKIIEEGSKGRPPERAQPVIKVVPSRATKTAVLEYFLLSLSPSVIETRLGPKLTRILTKYRQRRQKWDKRLEEWDIFLSKKPVPGKNHPDDEKLLNEARECIGDYKLKEDENYKPPPHLRETTVKKYNQVLEARLKQNDLRHKFIQKVWDIRDLKYVVRDRLIEMKNKILTLNEELPESLRKFGPNIPEIREAEFPEKKLQPMIILPVEEDVESVEPEPVQEFVKKPDQFRLESQVLPRFSHFPKILDGVFISPLSSNDIDQMVESEYEDLLAFPEETDTPMEMDVWVRRLNRIIYNQNQTIAGMDKEIRKFNNIIEEAKKERLPIHVGGNFIDIYILTLNQELNILKNFEDGEDQLSQKVIDNITLVHKLQDDIDMFKNKKEENDVIIDNYQIEETKIQEKFKHAAENNKFYDFLKKVFRKKFKPPKQVTDDDESSESSSSSSEESDYDDSASIDSRDFGFIKQDLNVCPKGCEVAIYNLTVDLRSKRHEIEQATKEQLRNLDTVKKDIEIGNRKLTVQQNQLQTSQNDLETYQREKQKLMNQVKCTVVLSLDQIYSCYSPEYDEITNYLVFSKTNLSDLYKRVGSLQYENFQQSTKYELYHRHLTRMKKDLRYMDAKVRQLKMHMQRLMLEKFGKLVDIDEITMAIIQRTFHKSHVDEMEEIVLKSRVYDIRMKNTDIKSMYIAELTHWNTKIRKALGELAIIIKENTKRLDLLHVMNKEKKELVKIITMQPKRIEQIEKILETHSQYVKDIEKLEKIIDDQCIQLQDLKIDIKMLKTKGLPPKSEVKADLGFDLRKKEEVDEEGTKEWVDYDKYIEREDDVIPEKQIQEINIPGLFYASESEDIVNELLKEIIDKACSDGSRESFDVEQCVRNILSGILMCPSIKSIINEIINNLPFEPTTEQQSAIDVAAEKLYQIQGPEVSDESLTRCARELLEDTIDEVLLMKGEAHEVIANLVKKLVESVPVDYLLKKESVDSIVKKVSDSMGEVELDKESLVKSIERIPSEYKQEMLSIINVILEKVFGTGIDYLYVIKYE